MSQNETYYFDTFQTETCQIEALSQNGSYHFGMFQIETYQSETVYQNETFHNEAYQTEIGAKMHFAFLKLKMFFHLVFLKFDLRFSNSKMFFHLRFLKSKVTVLAIVLSFLNTGCGQPEHTNFVAIEPLVVPYVAIFEAESVARGLPPVTNLVVQFGFTLWPQLAYCHMITYEVPLVIVNAKWWQSASEGQREALVMHELGHCVLERGHNNAYNSISAPESIMNAYLLDARQYETHREYYLDELFGRARL